MKTTALIVAAGSGVRMGSPSPKAFLELEGRPLVGFSLRLFESHPRVDGIVLVVPASRLAEARRIAGGFSRVQAVVEGGQRRQDSVARGLAHAGDDRDDLVLVHDAARPLADADLVSRVLEGAARTGAAVPGIAPNDTVRRAAVEGGEGGRILAGGTLDRGAMVLVQTPQGFRATILKQAFAMCGEADVTDDAALVEMMGQPVEVVAGSATNIKITRPEDLAVAAALMGGAGGRAR